MRHCYSLQSTTAPVKGPLGLAGLGRPLAKQVRTLEAFGTRATRYTPRPRYSTSDIAPEDAAGILYVGISPTVSGPPEAQSCVGVQTGTGRANRRASPGIGGSSNWTFLEASRRASGKQPRQAGITLMPLPVEILMSENHESNQSLTLSKAQANYA